MVKTAASKQMAVLSYIHQQVATHGYPPTVREICKAVGLSSTSTVHGHINRLIKKGYLQRILQAACPRDYARRHGCLGNCAKAGKNSIVRNRCCR